MLSQERIDKWAMEQCQDSPPLTEAQLTKIAAILYQDDHDWNIPRRCAAGLRVTAATDHHEGPPIPKQSKTGSDDKEEEEGAMTAGSANESLSDRRALDWISAILHAEISEADAMQQVAEIVELSGRAVPNRDVRRSDSR